MAKLPNIYKETIDNTNSVIELPGNGDIEIYYINTPNPLSLSTNLYINPDSTITYKDGYKYNIILEPFVTTSNTFNIYVFGRQLSTTEMTELSYITCVYVNGAWKININYFCCGGNINGGNIVAGTLDLGNAGIPGTLRLSNIFSLPQGGLITNNGIDNITIAPAKGNSILVSFGNNTNFYSVIGDLTMPSPGYFQIAPGAVTLDKLAYTPQEYQIVKKTISLTELGTIATSPLTLLSTPPAGNHYKLIGAEIKVNPGAIAFDANLLYIQYPSSSSPNLSIRNIIVSSSITIMAKMKELAEVTYTPGESVELTANANFSKGDGTIDIYLMYSVISL